MTAPAAHPAWEFVTRLYAGPGVAPACLALQDRHSIDVTFMLFCLWRGSVSRKPLRSHMPALAETARDWREAVVLPVRSARRRLKMEVGASSAPELAGLYRTVLAAEIDCERAELLRLAAQADALAGVARNDGSARIMAENLEAFFEASAVVLSTVDRSAVDTILQAATAGIPAV